LREPFRALRIGSAFLFCALISIVLLVVGQHVVAGGLMLGFAFYAANAFLLVETGRALLTSGQRGGRGAVVASAIGRIALLGVLLAGVFLIMGKMAGIGACGGLLVSQVNLHLPMRRTGVAT
jgi:hypothetical protein